MAPAVLLPVGYRRLRLDEKTREGMLTFITISAGTVRRNEKQYSCMQPHSSLHLSSSPSFHPKSVPRSTGRLLFWRQREDDREGWHLSNGKKENLAET